MIAIHQWSPNSSGGPFDHELFWSPLSHEFPWKPSVPLGILWVHASWSVFGASHSLFCQLVCQLFFRLGSHYPLASTPRCCFLGLSRFMEPFCSTQRNNFVVHWGSAKCECEKTSHAWSTRSHPRDQSTSLSLGCRTVWIFSTHEDQ